MDKIKLTKKHIFVMAMCLLAIAAIIAAILINKKGTEEIYTVPEEEKMDPMETMEIFPDDEYYGNYDKELTHEEKLYIERFLETYSVPNMLDLWNRIKDYKLTEAIYFEDFEGNRVVPANTIKPFIIYFAGVWKDGDGWTADQVSEDVARMKALVGRGDPDVYIIPYSTDISKEAIRSVLANSEYFYSIDRSMAELYNLVEGYANVCIYFNADGVPAFALKNANISTIIDYCDYVFESKFTMAEILEAVKDTVGGKATASGTAEE